MFQTFHILALSQPNFVRGQVTRLFSGDGDVRRDSFWRGWGFEER